MSHFIEFHDPDVSSHKIIVAADCISHIIQTESCRYTVYLKDATNIDVGWYSEDRDRLVNGKTSGSSENRPSIIHVFHHLGRKQV
jgi:hypothetical protein